ncbi:MAG: non-canonical purine NTP pyrophosphatase [Deltaproteobacteria bacterium]|nr:non-canonical purine NTP pyrophosphatase [Deltaproteobacteria bacterium]
MTTYLLASGNAKKARELAELVRALHGDGHRVLTLKDAGLDGVDVVEDAPDFAGNAAKKARGYLAAWRALPTSTRAAVDVVVADDSGLCVDALDGHPGVRSARWSGDCGYAPAGLSVDEANNQLLLALLAPVPSSRRTARFVAAVHAIDVASGVERAASGSVRGLIARDPSGAGGFGYDPLFVVDDGGDGGGDDVRGRRMAELTAEQKHAISHRGRALRSLWANPTA